jgi:hypothetical protein
MSILHIILWVWGLGVIPSFVIIAKQGMKNDLGAPVEGDALLSAIRRTPLSAWAFILLLSVTWPIYFFGSWFFHKMLGY